MRHRMLRVAQWLGGEDLRLMHIPQMRGVLARTMMETARQGGAGNRAEIERLVQPWGFDIAAIAGPRLFVWHGDEDATSCRSVRRGGDGARLTNATATFYCVARVTSPVLVNR